MSGGANPRAAKTRDEALALVPHYAREHAETSSGALSLARDLADAMFAVSEKDEPVDACYIAEWVSKWDFLLNVLSNSNDDLVAVLLNAGHRTVLASGVSVIRNQEWPGKAMEPTQN